MNRRIHFSYIVIVFFLSSVAHSNILFEGWFQVLLGSKKIGYLVEKYEFVDNKFKCVTYLKTNAEGSNVTESLKAVAASDMGPISYEYTSKAGDQIKVIDASFKADLMTLNIFDGTKKTQQTKRIKKGTFLSQFLIYLILSQKDGLKVGKDFKYNAIAEEEGVAYIGSVLVKNKEPVRGRDAFRLLNEFKGEKYFTWVNPRGETLLVRQPDRNIDVRFAETQAEATEGLTVNSKDLALLFGKIPGDTEVKSTEKPKGETKKKPSADAVEIKIVPPPKSDSPESTPGQ